MPTTLRRRTLVKAGLTAAAATLAAPAASWGRSPLSFRDYRSSDALGLAGLVRSGEVSPAELLQIAIERTEAVNPEINFIVEKLYDRARHRVDGNIGQ